MPRLAAKDDVHDAGDDAVRPEKIAAGNGPRRFFVDAQGVPLTSRLDARFAKESGRHAPCSSSRQMPPDRLELQNHLRSEHARLEGVFEQVLSAFAEDDREAVTALWARFDADLRSHMATEERVLIPILYLVDERAARSLLAEHNLIRSRLLELGAGVDLHVVRLDAARAFIDELRAHARHENRILYSWPDRRAPAQDDPPAVSGLQGPLKGLANR